MAREIGTDVGLVVVGGGEVRFDKVPVHHLPWLLLNPPQVIGIRPQVNGVGNAVPDGVGMDIAAEMEQIFIR